MPTERTEAILHGTVEAFAFFGCVPVELWWDNPKTVAIHIYQGRERTLHPRYSPVPSQETMTMSEANTILLKANLRQLKLLTIHAEWEKLAREAADRDEPHDAYLLRLTELEVAARTSNAIPARIRAAGFPVLKDFDTFDFTATPNLLKQKILELARGEWVD